jgi:hypothetical protein
MCAPKAVTRHDRARARRIVTMQESRVSHRSVQSRTSKAPPAALENSLQAQFITYPTRNSVQSSGATSHYGQAQKLLNMSLKYLYNEFAFYHGKLNQFCFPDNNIEYFFHLPIDNQILNYLIKQYNFAHPYPTSLVWSKWTYDHYINFQSQLRNRISSQYKPLEIDYMIWNSQGASVGNAIT